MKRIVVLDSTPLGLLLHTRKYPQVDECRRWLSRQLQAGARVVVPEVIDYEVRRELLRLGRAQAVAALDAFISAESDRFLPLTTTALHRAAELWAESRRRGQPTSDRHALDIDVILAGQVLTSGLPLADLVVASANIAHLAAFVPAEEWGSI